MASLNKAGGVLLLNRDHLVYWKSAEDENPQHASGLTEVYGTIQYLTTGFQFANVSEYYRIKAIFTRIFGFELNDKYIRPKGVLK